MRQPCCKHRIAPGFGGRKPLPVGQRADAGLRHRDVIVEGNADGVGQLVRAELHQTASRKRDRRKAKHRGIPATGRNIEGIDQPAVHFIGNDDRCDQFACAGALGFGDSETCRNVVAGMNGEAPYIGIVEVEVTECGRIREGGEFRCRPPLGADDGRRARGGKRDLAADADRFFIPCAHAAADGVDQKRFHAFDGRAVELFVGQAMSIGGKPLGQRPLTSFRSGRRWMIFSHGYPRSERKCTSAKAQRQELSSWEFHYATHGNPAMA